MNIEIKMKRELMDVLNQAIPVLDIVELNTLAVTLNRIIEHMDERGVIFSEE